MYISVILHPLAGPGSFCSALLLSLTMPFILTIYFSNQNINILSYHMLQKLWIVEYKASLDYFSGFTVSLLISCST